MKLRMKTLLCGGASLALGLGVLAPASAAGAAGGDLQGSGRNSVGNGVDGGGGATQSRDVGVCHAVSSENYVGVSCGTVKGGGKRTIKEILGKDKLPTCWNEPMTEKDRHDVNVENVSGPDGYTYWWYECLSGVDPKTLKEKPGGLKVSWGWDKYPNTPSADKKIVLLTGRQKDLIDSTRHGKAIPQPLAGISPTGDPVVNQSVAFYDASAHEVDVEKGGLMVRASVTKTRVHPISGASAVSCANSGRRASAGQTPSDLPGACWYKFTRSSADEPDQRFAGSIDVTWSVRYSSDGGKHWQPLNSFVKRGLTTQEVEEVQALNVQ